MVLSNGMEKTSHWAALYFVALMTFGNYVLFNLLVAILVEGFSSERNERREREQRELAKRRMSVILEASLRNSSGDSSRSLSSSSGSYIQVSNKPKNYHNRPHFSLGHKKLLALSGRAPQSERLQRATRQWRNLWLSWPPDDETRLLFQKNRNPRSHRAQMQHTKRVEHVAAAATANLITANHNTHRGHPTRLAQHDHRGFSNVLLQTHHCRCGFAITNGYNHQQGYDSKNFGEKLH